MSHGATLLHNDRDFATIAKLRSLKHLQFDPFVQPEASSHPIRPKLSSELAPEKLYESQ